MLFTFLKIAPVLDNSWTISPEVDHDLCITTCVSIFSLIDGSLQLSTGCQDDYSSRLLCTLEMNTEVLLIVIWLI